MEVIRSYPSGILYSLPSATVFKNALVPNCSTFCSSQRNRIHVCVSSFWDRTRWRKNREPSRSFLCIFHRPHQHGRASSRLPSAPEKKSSELVPLVFPISLAMVSTLRCCTSVNGFPKDAADWATCCIPAPDQQDRHSLG